MAEAIELDRKFGYMRGFSIDREIKTAAGVELEFPLGQPVVVLFEGNLKRELERDRPACVAQRGAKNPLCQRFRVARDPANPHLSADDFTSSIRVEPSLTKRFLPVDAM